MMKEYFRQTREHFKNKHCSRNLIIGRNTWAVLLVSYSGPFLKWIKEELRDIDQRTRKLKWEEKQLNGYSKQQTGKILHEKTRTWLQKGNLKRETEPFPTVAQTMQ